MTPEVLTAVGWCVAALLGGLHLRTRQRLVLVARASHELRGPICAARLGLGTLAGEPGRVAAIDLELARAGRALDDLTAAPARARTPASRELVDLTALARDYAPSWAALAKAHGAGFQLEAAGSAAARPPAAAGERPRMRSRRRHLRLVPPAPGDDRAVGAPVTWRADGPPPPPAAPMWAAKPRTTVVADPFRIAQAVANLVANAAEHGGGVVRVRIRPAGERVWVEVADDGPGLPAPVTEMAAAARSRTGRRGHGLAIAAGIAAHHGGRLAAVPAGAGARLVLDLPAAR
jgi:signal transduction histidine kinase